MKETCNVIVGEKPKACGREASYLVEFKDAKEDRSFFVCKKCIPAYEFERGSFVVKQLNKNFKLRVWHIPQIPGKAFRIEVGTIKEAKKILNLLADYDAFEFKHKIKPDYSNTQGLEVFENNEWIDWEDEDGNNIDDAEAKE